MGKNILILNGSPRAKGNTEILIEHFANGAKEKGHQVHSFDVRKLKVNPCIGCLKGGSDKEPLRAKRRYGRNIPGV